MLKHVVQGLIGIEQSSSTSDNPNPALLAATQVPQVQVAPTHYFQWISLLIALLIMGLLII
ncbi:hypothetical protein [Herpetosiphon llansteffanensis]|uniref:hypothetical protein n=1 Tax=Herpetosiphon llansteffanensis TaxID=2094568 RepID=UPI000F519BCD|nr:hypothetical protein [Herpetosiphon llansteffanensis]